MNTTTENFNTNAEFDKWKLKVEDKYCCKFVKQTGERLDSHDEKAPGKSAITCTSTIKRIEDKDGSITAEIVETHYDHNLELQHVPIPDDKKEEIAAKLQQGICNERIIDDIRNSCNNDEFDEGSPNAWCLSNHEDFTHMYMFFKMIKRNCGRLSPKWFMTDLQCPTVLQCLGSHKHRQSSTIALLYLACGQGMERRAKKENRESRQSQRYIKCCEQFLNQMKKVLMNT
ncbi:Hypothetical predicted protein [Paramuricea clavata]|uniref:Uncharacterized protein n=1 Tax=Paramuricea clavata TaxID=317549 RepID=A0A6S7JKN2_PARCT|nr:Hypothetical predicted protein [Paramuricea clavata]